MTRGQIEASLKRLTDAYEADKIPLHLCGCLNKDLLAGNTSMHATPFWYAIMNRISRLYKLNCKQ